MARKITPRHIAKTIEAEKVFKKPPRFNQVRSDNGDLMYPLNSAIPPEIYRLLDLGVETITRTIVEDATTPPVISLEAQAPILGANDYLREFIDLCADEFTRENQNRALGFHDQRAKSFISYEGTIYAVHEVDMSEGTTMEERMSMEMNRTRRSVLTRGYVMIKAEALPSILKIKGK